MQGLPGLDREVSFVDGRRDGPDDAFLEIVFPAWVNRDYELGQAGLSDITALRPGSPTIVRKTVWIAS